VYERDRGNETERVCVIERAREKERKVSECQRDRARERERKRDFDIQNKPCHPYVKVTSYEFCIPQRWERLRQRFLTQ